MPLWVLLQFDAPTVLLSLLAIGLWVASRRSRTATIAAALLIATAIAGVLVGAFPYDLRTYQASQVRGAAALAFLCSLTGGVVLAGVGLLRSGRPRWGVFSLALGVVMAWVAVIAGGLGALSGAKQPQLVAMLARLSATIGSTVRPVASRPGLVILLHGAYGSGLQMEIWTRFDFQADRLHWIAAIAPVAGSARAVGCTPARPVSVPSRAPPTPRFPFTAAVRTSSTHRSKR